MVEQRPRIESSSSDHRDESEESRSRSASTQRRPGRGGQQPAQPRTPPCRLPPPSTSPRRSPRLGRSDLTKDFQRLPLSAKSDTRRTAHSWLASEDKRGRHASRSSRSSSEQGRSDQARRSREPTPPQLLKFNINDFTLVSHTETSFLFTSLHPFFPGWVRVVSAHSRDHVRKLPCPNDPDEGEEAKKRIR